MVKKKSYKKERDWIYSLKDLEFVFGRSLGHKLFKEGRWFYVLKGKKKVRKWLMW